MPGGGEGGEEKEPSQRQSDISRENQKVYCQTVWIQRSEPDPSWPEGTAMPPQEAVEGVVGNS